VKKRPVLSSWSHVLDYCRTAMAFENKEQFRVVLFIATFSFVIRCLFHASLKRPRRVPGLCS
jgi:DNA repair protein RadC